MEKQFQTYYDKLPENYKHIILQTMRRMQKSSNEKPPKKKINLKNTINEYLKRNNMKETELLEKCIDLDIGFSEDTYKSIKKRNIVNISKNETLKIVASILNIPSDENGNLYIEYEIPEELQIGNINKHRVYSYTNEYYSYMTKYDSNSILYSFKHLSKQNQGAITYLTTALYYNISSPELFLPNDINDEL